MQSSKIYLGPGYNCHTKAHLRKGIFLRRTNPSQDSVAFLSSFYPDFWGRDYSGVVFQTGFATVMLSSYLEGRSCRNRVGEKSPYHSSGRPEILSDNAGFNS